MESILPLNIQVFGQLHLQPSLIKWLFSHFIENVQIMFSHRFFWLVPSFFQGSAHRLEPSSGQQQCYHLSVHT